MTLKVYLLSSWGAGLSSVLYSFKSCDFSCGPFCKIQGSLGLIWKAGPVPCTQYSLLKIAYCIDMEVYT
jgi:hypothetical protein